MVEGAECIIMKSKYTLLEVFAFYIYQVVAIFLPLHPRIKSAIDSEQI